jgi:carbamate kinase
MSRASEPVRQTISHDRVVRNIGGGGTGVVYEAEDLQRVDWNAVSLTGWEAAALRRYLHGIQT